MTVTTAHADDRDPFGDLYANALPVSAPGAWIRAAIDRQRAAHRGGVVPDGGRPDPDPPGVTGSPPPGGRVGPARTKPTRSQTEHGCRQAPPTIAPRESARRKGAGS